jgi:hypothetical protein
VKSGIHREFGISVPLHERFVFGTRHDYPANEAKLNYAVQTAAKENENCCNK